MSNIINNKFFRLFVFVLLLVSIQNHIFADVVSDDLAKLQKSAENGDGDAQYDLGWCYDLGCRGVSHDFIKAIYWFTKAAE